MMEQRPNFHPESVYHLYNRANGGENLFRQEENFHFFIRRYLEYLSEIVDTYAYCLMPNHFHFLIKVKDRTSIEKFVQKRAVLERKAPIPAEVPDDERVHYVVHRQLKNFLSSYVKAFNHFHQRKGSLLQQNTKRKVITDTNYLLTAVQYIHLNPFHHQFVKNPLDWSYSSFQEYVYDVPSFLAKEEVIDLFGGLEQFKSDHTRRQEIIADFLPLHLGGLKTSKV